MFFRLKLDPHHDQLAYIFDNLAAHLLPLVSDSRPALTSFCARGVSLRAGACLTLRHF